MPHQLEQGSQAARGVAIVVHHQNYAPDPGARVRAVVARAGRRRQLAAARRRRQGDGKGAAFTGAGAFRADAAAMHFHQPLHKREPDAEPAVRALERTVALYEHVEDIFQHFAVDADARVGDHDRDLLAVYRGGQRDVSAGGRVLVGVVEQVGDHLRQARGIDVEIDVFRRQHDHQLVLRFDLGADSFKRVFHHGGQQDALTAQVDLAGVDARYVEQIVDQPAQLRNLALHDAVRIGNDFLVAAGGAQDLQRIAQRR